MTIDVENAFNTAGWDRIIAKLEVKQVSTYLVNVIRYYPTKRKLIVEVGNGSA